jgi:cytoskeletal protein CcmA (bactofilin family)
VSTQAVARSRERTPGVNIPRDNWLGFVGDVVKFTGEVSFKTSLRIDGNFCGQINSENGTLTVTAGANLSGAVIRVAVARINGTVEGQIHADDLVLGCTSKVSGEVSARTLTVEQGAVFDGNCVIAT